MLTERVVPESPPRVRKRPATRQAARPKRAATRCVEQPPPVQYNADGNAKAECAIPPPPWSEPAPASHPSWALHAVRVLQGHSHLPAMPGQDKSLELTLWSDCSGINSDMFALRELGEALHTLLNVNVKWVLYFTCDLDMMSRTFSELNHNPLHTSDKMEHRNFETGQVYCTKHEANHDLPRHGVDLYVGTYPCSPWSRRGLRTCFCHPDAQATVIGFKTIAFMSPAVFVVEIGEMPSQVALDEIQDKVRDILQAGVAQYTIQFVRNLTPAWSGFPTRRKRLFIIGWRADIDGAHAGRPLQSLMDTPMTVNHSFLHFLGLKREIDWSRVGECPTQQELLLLSGSSCSCGLDSMLPCVVHPCKCGRCGTSGTECAWRRLIMNFVASGTMQNVISKKRAR
jgi:hypothetical protein